MATKKDIYEGFPTVSIGTIYSNGKKSVRYDVSYHEVYYMEKGSDQIWHNPEVPQSHSVGGCEKCKDGVAPGIEFALRLERAKHAS